MANRKISDLTALTAPVTGDLLPIVDISEAAAADKNKKITYGTFLSSVPLGTAAAPSIAFTGDTNTGIYSPGADQVALATNGTGRLFVDASGRIAIGSSSVASSQVVLEVGGYDSAQLRISAPSAYNANFRGLTFGQNGVSDYYAALRAELTLGELRQEIGYSGWGGFQTFYTNGLERLRINSFGNVGVGTTSPGGTVDIKAAASTAPLIVQGSSTEFARIDSSGRLLVGGSSDSGGALLQVFGDRIRVGTAKTPASASATGTAGEICWDASYIYVCTATNTWKRTAIATW